MKDQPKCSLKPFLLHKPTKVTGGPILKSIRFLQCNIGGNPQARLAKGSVLSNMILAQDPTIVLLVETKRKRKDIPDLAGYNFYSQDPFKGSSGGIVLYFKKNLCFRLSKAYSSDSASILWIKLQHHKNRLRDLYVCGVYAPCADVTLDKKNPSTGN